MHATPPVVTKATENQNSLQPFNSFIIDDNTFLPATLSFNKIFGTNIAPPEDPEFAHNQVQVFVAIIIGILSAFGQYLRFKHTPSDQIKKCR